MSRNNRISDETLFGYLLIALPEEEQWRIETLALSDSILRQRIKDLRDLLGPMGELSSPVEPRADLTTTTMAFIEAASKSGDSLLSVPSVRMSQPLFESDRATRLAWIDSLVALAAGIVVLTLLLPSIWYSRESSRRISCASNLRELGHAISLFSQVDTERRLPRIEVDGPLSFAGVYAMRLKDAGLLESRKWIWCPAVESFDVDQPIPSLQTFLAASPRQQQNLKNTVGGNYSFNLGNEVEGDYVTPGFNGKSYFAVIGDSLLSVATDEETTAVHGGNLANVLYDDGRIQSVHLHQRNVAPMLDNPYLNREMQQAVGHGLDDTCLGPSFQNPFKPVH
ncbi:MAG TPA: hypothetical protein VM260_17375 [Pirellula sp.]|nr:hypothetical protein [Pirellula sp.]